MQTAVRSVGLAPNPTHNMRTSNFFFSVVWMPTSDDLLALSSRALKLKLATAFEVMVGYGGRGWNWEMARKRWDACWLVRFSSAPSQGS